MGWNAQNISLIVLTEQTTGYSGLFGYSPFPGPLNLIFSVSAAAGVDPYGNSYPQGISSSLGALTTNSIVTRLLEVSGGPFLFYGNQNAAQVTFTAGQSGNWTVPSGVTAITSVLIAGGGNGSSLSNPPFGDVGNGGGGGESALQGFTVSPGNLLPYSVGNAGQNTTFNGIIAHAGQNGGSQVDDNGAGGTGSNAAVSYAGGSGAGVFNTGSSDFPGGGGSSGGTSQPGNAAPVTSSQGGAAVAGGGAGGSAYANGGSPGGGGGGGGPSGGAAGTGAGGLLSIFYATSNPANTDLLVAIANLPGSDALGNSWGTGLTIESTAVPATPAAGCILYYSGGVLYAVGPSGNSIAIATT